MYIPNASSSANSYKPRYEMGDYIGLFVYNYMLQNNRFRKLPTKTKNSFGYNEYTFEKNDDDNEDENRPAVYVMPMLSMELYDNEDNKNNIDGRFIER